MANQGSAERSNPLSGLTEQRRCCSTSRRGLTNKQIAARMFLAEKTVKNYVSRLARQIPHGKTHSGRGVRLHRPSRPSETEPPEDRWAPTPRPQPHGG
jgi:DNA-binding CsgD family transcriptional regulator